MALTEDQLVELLCVAETAARRAGAVIRARVGCEHTVTQKDDQGSFAAQVVTEVDSLAEEAILATLAPATAAYHIGVLTEEREDDGSRLEQDYFWAVDPLDGTLAFVERLPGYSVSIALVARDGTPVLGVVYDLWFDRLYRTVRGKGVQINGFNFGLSEVAEKPLTVVCDRSLVESDGWQQTQAKLDVVAQEWGFGGIKLIKNGGAAMNAIWVLEQRPAVYFKYPKAEPGGGCIWDFAATACIYQELGAHVSDAKGNPLTLNRECSPYFNDCGILFASDEEVGAAVLTALR